MLGKKIREIRLLFDDARGTPVMGKVGFLHETQVLAWESIP